MLPARVLSVSLLLASPGVPVFAAFPNPIAVSPGAESEPLLAPSACPTFSWGAARRDGEGFEIVVYGVSDDGAWMPEPSLRQYVVAGASSWTPPGDRCLAPGRYAWMLRALTKEEKPGWSRPRFFVVADAKGPDVDAFIERAVERVLRRLLTEHQPMAGGRPRLAPAPAGERTALAADPDQRPTAGDGAGAGNPSFIADAAAFNFPACTEVPSLFADVPNDHPLCPFIKQFSADEISTGCAADPDPRFCPDEAVTRAQLAVYLERAMRGTTTWDVTADLLDGLDSTDFATASHDHDAAYVDVGGDTMTGNLGLSANLLLDIGSSATDFTAGGGLALAGALVATGSVSLSDSPSDVVTVSGTIAGALPLNFEGGTADGNELTLAVAALTVDRTVTLPDATGTLITTGNETFVNIAGDTMTGGLVVAPLLALGTAVDLSDADIGVALNVGAHSVLGTTAVIDFTNFDVAASGNTSTLGTLSASGATTLTGGVSIGTAFAGAIARSTYDVSNQNFGSIPAETCSESSLTAPGQIRWLAGSVCVLGVQPDLADGLIGMCYVPMLDNIVVRLCNVTTGAVDPPATDYLLRTFAP